MWGAIGSIGATLLGGLFAKSAAKQERANSIADTLESMPRLRESAEKAGFNPLSVLGSSAAGTFNNIASGVAPLASTSMLQNMASDIAGAWEDHKAQKETRDKAEDIVGRVAGEQSHAGGAGAVYARTSAARMARPGAVVPGAFLTSAVAQMSDQPTPQLEAGQRLSTNPWTLGTTVYTDPRRPDAEHGEQRYGDVAQEVFGVANLGSDWNFNRKMQNLSEKVGPRGVDLVLQGLDANPQADLGGLIRDAENSLPHFVRPRLRPARGASGSWVDMTDWSYPKLFN